jgi:hypothetical protein
MGATPRVTCADARPPARFDYAYSDAELRELADRANALAEDADAVVWAPVIGSSPVAQSSGSFAVVCCLGGSICLMPKALPGGS